MLVGSCRILIIPCCTRSHLQVTGLDDVHITQSHAHMGHTSQTTTSHSGGARLLPLMLLDGVGLALISACTIYDGYEMWIDEFSLNMDGNLNSILFWFVGRFLQVVGLLSLILHAGTMQKYHELEHFGMTLLTVGPILNICACGLYNTTPTYDYSVFNKQWMFSEVVELIGMLVLDLSVVFEEINAESYLILLAEVLGFAVLECAAMLEFIYSSTNGSYWVMETTPVTTTVTPVVNGTVSAVMHAMAHHATEHTRPLSYGARFIQNMSYFPDRLAFRFDMSHVTDGVGLVLLIVVAFVQYNNRFDTTTATAAADRSNPIDQWYATDTLVYPAAPTLKTTRSDSALPLTAATTGGPGRSYGWGFASMLQQLGLVSKDYTPDIPIADSFAESSSMTLNGGSARHRHGLRVLHADGSGPRSSSAMSLPHYASWNNLHAAETASAPLSPATTHHYIYHTTHHDEVSTPR